MRRAAKSGTTTCGATCTHSSTSACRRSENGRGKIRSSAQRSTKSFAESPISSRKAAELMEYLETYACGARANHEAGCLVPYFALCLFGGLRPACDDGEVRKLADSPDIEKLIDLKLGVIRIAPEISKVGFVRQVKIRPNLAAWLDRYHRAHRPEEDEGRAA